MRKVARSRLAGRDVREIAAKSGAAFGMNRLQGKGKPVSSSPECQMASDGAILLQSFGQTVSICLEACQFSPEIGDWHALTLLHYLDLADGAALTGRLISFADYPDGLIRGAGFDRNAELVIRRDLGVLPPEALRQRALALGAELLPSNADFCARISFAPRYPLFLKIWYADEELPASGRLLLDESAPHYLTIEDAVTVGSLLLDALTGAELWAQAGV